MGLLIGVGNTDPQFPYTSLWYGIKINLNHGGKDTKDGKIERVGNLDLHRQLPIQKKIRRFVANADGSVNYWLGADDSTKKEGGGNANLNGTDGNVLLYKPDYYRRMEFDNGYLLVAISEVALPGFVKMKEQARSPWFATMNRKTDTPASVCCLTWGSDGKPARDASGLLVFTSNAADYRGGTNDSSRDGTNKSELGMPACNMNKATVRAKFKNLNADMTCHGGGWRFREEMGWLMAIEFGSLDSQATYTAEKTEDGFAQGGIGAQSVDWGEWSTFNNNRPFIPCGITAKLGNNTGRVSYTIKNWKTGTDKEIFVPSYRGWETPQQYLWEENDDVIIWHGKPSDGDTSLLYVCEDATKFTTPSDTSTAVPDGYKEVGALPRTSGYIAAMAVGNGWSCPTSVAGGAANKNYGDYYWYPTVTDDSGWGWYQLLSCAHAGYTEDSGVRCALAVTRGSNTNTLCGFPFVQEIAKAA